MGSTKSLYFFLLLNHILHLKAKAPPITTKAARPPCWLDLYLPTSASLNMQMPSIHTHRGRNRFGALWTTLYCICLKASPLLADTDTPSLTFISFIPLMI